MSNAIIQSWQADHTYAPGDVVLHNGSAYHKLDDGDNTEPDAVGGGWQALENSNAVQFNIIAARFNSYEARRDAHLAAMAAARSSAHTKLQALGLTAEELKALGL